MSEYGLDAGMFHVLEMSLTYLYIMQRISSDGGKVTFNAISVISLIRDLTHLSLQGKRLSTSYNLSTA